MPAPVLFLESLSGYQEEISNDVATQTAKQLVGTLRRAWKVNPKLSLNSGEPLCSCRVAPNWPLNAALGGVTHKEEWEFLKILADRSPLSSGLEEWIAQASVIEARYSGIESPALAWASLLETATISFFAQPPWQLEWIKAECYSLDEEGNEQAFVEEIRNASSTAHIDTHKEWLNSLGYEHLPPASVLWAEKEHRFPGLRFLPRVLDDLANLATSGTPYRQALETLDILSGDAVNWTPAISAPTFSVKVSPEHEQRKEYCLLRDDLSGNEYYFDMHARFTGGMPGRIHFRIDSNEGKFIVAYVGFKLSGPIQG